MFHVEQKILHTPSMFGLLYQSMRPLRPRSVSTRCFNPRVCDGRDEVDGVLMHRHVVSIHASARDATSGSCILNGSACFNPRVREGRDALAENDADDRVVSIHASARDATGADDRIQSRRAVSIHASARDATYRQPVRHCQ